MYRTPGEAVIIDPRDDAVTSLFCTLGRSAVLLRKALTLVAEVNPNTGAYMANVNDVNNQGTKTGEIVLPLLRVFGKELTHDHLNRNCKPEKVNKSETLEPVFVDGLVEEDEFGKGSNQVKKEQTGHVIECDGLDVLIGPRSFNKVQRYLHHEEDVDHSLSVHHEDVLVCLSFQFFLSIFRRIVLIHLLENKDEWYHDQLIDNQERNGEVPSFAKGLLRIDKVPLDLRLVLVDLFFIYVLVQIVDCHLFEI